MIAPALFFVSNKITGVQSAKLRKIPMSLLFKIKASVSGYSILSSTVSMFEVCLWEGLIRDLRLKYFFIISLFLFASSINSFSFVLILFMLY